MAITFLASAADERGDVWATLRVVRSHRVDVFLLWLIAVNDRLHLAGGVAVHEPLGCPLADAVLAAEQGHLLVASARGISGVPLSALRASQLLRAPPLRAAQA